MGAAEVEGIEGVGRGVMLLIWLWKGVEKSKREYAAGPTRKGSLLGTAAEGGGLLTDGQLASP
jgi:hypothetical protein